MTNPVAAGRLSLPTELHAATRNEHTTLNRTIISRLPLCLPTAASTPDLYAQGMTVIGQLYYGIEEAWDMLLLDKTISPRDRSILTELNIPQIRRTKRLETSLQQLRFKSKDAFGEQLPNLAAATTHFRNEVRQSILQQPHLLMAYTWTMYLALFNGGRFIAKQLLAAGSLFWKDEDRATTVSGALAFWFFGDSEDYNGEDVKVAFKQRFDTVAEDLTDAERDEIVAESKKIFQMCAAMVAFLDQHVQSGSATAETQASSADAASRTDVTSQATPTTASALGYLASFTPTAVTSLWRSVFTNTSFPLLLRQEIDQKN